MLDAAQSTRILAHLVHFLALRVEQDGDRIDTLEHAMSRIDDLESAVSSLKGEAATIIADRDQIAAEKAALATEHAQVTAGRDELLAQNNRMEAVTADVVQIAASLKEPAPTPDAPVFEPSANGLTA